MSTVNFLNRVESKHIGLYTDNEYTADLIYVDVDVLTLSLKDVKVFGKWGAVLIDGEALNTNLVLKLSAKTELKFDSATEAVFFNAYGSAGWYSRKYVPREVHQAIYVWLLSYKPAVAKATPTPTPEPRKSKRLGEKRHKPNYRV